VIFPATGLYTATIVTGQTQSSLDFGNVQDTTRPTPSPGNFQFETSPHRVEVQFSEDVGASLSAADFSVTNLNTVAAVPFTLSYSGALAKATLTFSGALPDANFRLRVIASGIVDNAGNVMLSDATTDFFFLAADATRNRSVGSEDFNILATNFGASGKVFSQGNFSYDAPGNVDSADFNILASQFGKTLPGSDESARPSGGAPGFGGSGSLFSGSGSVRDDDDELV
jgi:hypothetical protein